MKVTLFFRRSCLCALACLALYGLINQAGSRAATLGDMNADSILFLGNSITLHGPYIEWIPDAHWGMAASEESKDYVHLLTSQINAASGGSMQVAHDDPLPGRWFYGDDPPGYVGNILNVADIFERNYDTWDNVRIQNQINAQPDIVVLQFGENLSGGTDQQLATALDTMLTGLKNAGDPHIFITSSILGTQSNVDAIKQQACAADPSKRFFVDLNGIVDNSGAAGHPSDTGMQTIADTIFNTMLNGNPPQPWTLNIDINGRSNTGQSNVTRTGAAAIGAAGDVWNGYSIDASAASPPAIDPAQSGFLLDANGNTTTVKFDITMVGADAPMATSDDMANDLAFVEGPNAGSGFPVGATCTLSGLQPGDTYDMYLYAAPASNLYSSTFTIGEQTGTTMAGNTFNDTDGWIHGMNYVKVPAVTVAEDGTIVCEFESGSPTSYGMFNGLQLREAEPMVEVVGTPVNIDINGRSNELQVNTTNSGAAVIGTTGDVWNGYSVDASAVSPPVIDPAQSDFLVDADGNTTTIKFDLTMVGADAPAALQISGDDMGSDLAFVEGPSTMTGFPVGATFTLSGLEAGEAYDLYLYAAAATTQYASTFTIGDTSLSTLQGSVFTGIWVEGDNYVKFSNIFAAEDGTIVCDFESGIPDNYGMLSGLQIIPSVSNLIPGDANGDGVVNADDAAILAANWQGTGKGWGQGDFNDDGIVNDIDATLLASNWQTGAAPGASVPEPSLAIMLAGIVLSIVFVRRR